MYMWIRTKDGDWYVEGIHGSSYVSWVHISEIEHADPFPKDKVSKWLELLEDWTGFELEAVTCE